jgi:mannosyltransferase OCH1-like enzyme
MIPNIIHYCWFGGNSLPESAKKCIGSWVRYFPSYEIVQWNESNYDVSKIPYIREAYDAKKYAFVSDYARFDILYQEGGLYFDTDVEVIKPFDDIIQNGPFMGCEIDGGDGIKVAPGLCLGADPGMRIYKKIIDFYSTQHFLNSDGSINSETVVLKTTKILIENGLLDIPGEQDVCGIRIYPKDFFNPLNNNTGVLYTTNNTHSIHWYSMSWMNKREKIRRSITRVLHRLFGEDFFEK